jgi:hypothetical protein
MPFEQGIGGSEFAQDLVFGHCLPMRSVRGVD